VMSAKAMHELRRAANRDLPSDDMPK